MADELVPAEGEESLTLPTEAETETPTESQAPAAAGAAETEAPAAEAATEATETESLADSLTLGGEAEVEVEAQNRPAPVIRGKLDRHGVAIGTGRRKTAVARVRISDGTGKILINEREMKEYFPLERDQNMILAPLSATESTGTVDVWVRVTGGGPTGQTGAVVLGIARALEGRNPALHAKLSEDGFLTRDGRMVERKKYGHKKARKSFQFSKR